LLQVWKSFEEQRGTADDIAKVEGMMPVQGKRRYVDEETGQLVEGTHFPHPSRA
jgi:crooked neck